MNYRWLLLFHHYLLLGEWKAFHPRHGALRATIDAGEIRFSLDMPRLGGLYTTRKAFEGNFMVKNETHFRVSVRRHDSVLTSVLGFETALPLRPKDGHHHGQHPVLVPDGRYHERHQPPPPHRSGQQMGIITGSILCSSPTVVIMSVTNRLRRCDDRSTSRIILHRVVSDEKITSTPIPIFLMGQFTGFCVSHWFDLLFHLLTRGDTPP